jgi:hypothetical protein
MHVRYVLEFHFNRTHERDSSAVWSLVSFFFCLRLVCNIELPSTMHITSTLLCSALTSFIRVQLNKCTFSEDLVRFFEISGVRSL